MRYNTPSDDYFVFGAHQKAPHKRNASSFENRRLENTISEQIVHQVFLESLIAAVQDVQMLLSTLLPEDVFEMLDDFVLDVDVDFPVAEETLQSGHLVLVVHQIGVPREIVADYVRRDEFEDEKSDNG